MAKVIDVILASIGYPTYLSALVLSWLKFLLEGTHAVSVAVLSLLAVAVGIAKLIHMLRQNRKALAEARSVELDNELKELNLKTIRNAAKPPADA